MEYTIKNNALVKYEGSETQIILPAVQEIGESAFYNNESVQHVLLKNGVKKLGPWSFGYCRNLRSIYLPSTVTEIHPSAFDGCLSLEEIIVSTHNARFSCNDGVLYNNMGTSLLLYPRGKKQKCFSIDSSVVRIEDNAFNRAAHINEIIIGKSVEHIGYKAFAYCIGLQRICVPKSVKSIGYCAFANCDRLTCISVDEENTFYKSNDGCLFSCDGAKLIQFPLGCKRIEYSISEHVYDISERAFSCSNLEVVRVSPQNKRYKDIDGVLFSKDGKTLLFYPKHKKLKRYLIPDGVERICNSAFKENSYIEEILFPNSLHEIERHAFEGCTKLKLLDLSETHASEIGWSAFAECPSLASVILPFNKKCVIQGHAFFDCDALEHVVFSRACTSFGFDVFGGRTPFYTNEL